MVLEKLNNAQAEEKRSLSTFAGVFTPSILTILGVILYLRLGWVVGSVGVIKALLIVSLASVITFITGLSISAVATNMKVETGGAYYMISRSLGFSFGGSIGLPLYFSQALSIPLYVIGFVESLRLVWPGVDVQLLSIVVVVLITAFSFIGAKFVIKLQYIIFTAIILSLISYFSGVFSVHSVKFAPIFWQSLSGMPDFWKVFAVYFPAVTGILAGVSMSGDLKNPQRAIPWGTLSAILVGFIVYFLVALTMGFHASAVDLLNNHLVMANISKWPFLVLAGIWGATLSSAFGSILGAPRTLQALARDKIINPVVGKGFGKQDEPLIALGFTFVIALIAVAFGSIDTIAPVLTMFFLTTYGALNLVSGIETLVKNPQFRPQFKTPWFISIAGAFACFATMFLINHIASIIAFVVVFIIFFSLKRNNLKQTWGDISKGIWLTLVNFALKKLKELKNDPKNWRPNILVFSTDPDKQKELVTAAHWFAQENGIVLACNLLRGKLEKNVREIIKADKKSEAFIKDQDLDAFVMTSVIENFEKDTAIIAQVAGIGDIKPNTVMFPWQETSWLQQKHFISMIRNQFYIGKNTLILATNPRYEYKEKKVDLWWGGKDRNLELMLLLGHLLSISSYWKKGELTIKTIIDSKRGVTKKEQEIREILQSARIKANIEIVKKNTKQTIAEQIVESSKDAKLTFLGLAYPEKGAEREYYQWMSNFTQELPAVIFVRNSKRSGAEIV